MREKHSICKFCIWTVIKDTRTEQELADGHVVQNKRFCFYYPPKEKRLEINDTDFCSKFLRTRKGWVKK